MVDEQGVVKLVDFGFLVEKPERIMHDALYGTPGYIAPESRRGQFSVATDIYALGVTIYDLVPDSMHSVLRIARLMWADNPDLRPSLELVKLALLVRKSMGVSHERLAQILVENDAETQNPEDAIVAGVVLANATIENGFSDRDNFDLLVANSMLREIILGVVSAPDLQQFIFQILKNSKVDHFLNPHSVLQKSFAKLKADNQASPHNLYRLMKYSSFRKWLSADHFLVDQLSELFCELVYQNDLDFLRSLLLDENSLALRLRAQNGFMDALSTALDSAISQRKLAIAVELILFGAESEDQSTVIFLLAAAGELNLLKRLLSHDRDQLNSQNVSGDTPLMLAASHGHDAVIEYFITQAVDLNVRNNCQNKPKSLGNTALFYAIDQGKWSSAKLLLKAGADPKLNGAFNCSPLLRCLQQNQFEMAAYCLFYGANLDLQTRKLMVQHKADLVAAINDMLKSELCSDVAGAELGLAFLRRLGVIKNPDSDDQLFPALFGGCCIGLFKPASLRLLEKLAENLSKPRAGIMELVA